LKGETTVFFEKKKVTEVKGPLQRGETNQFSTEAPANKGTERRRETRTAGEHEMVVVNRRDRSAEKSSAYCQRSTWDW